MADQNAKLLDLDEIWYSEVCGAELKIQKLTMADPI